MHSHAMQITRKVTEVLDRHDVPYTVKEKGKHPHIEFTVNNQAHRVPLHSKRISGGFYDIIPTMRRVERIVTQQEDEMSATATIVQIHSPNLTIESIRDFDGEPRIDDATLGAVLGYARSKSGLRPILQRRAEEVETYGPVISEQVPTTERGGRPGVAYFLNEAQALLVTMFSDAPGAQSIRRRLIEVFLEWKRQHQAPALPAPAESEILANEAAIERITRAVVGAMGGREIAPVVPANAERPVMAAEVRTMLEGIFRWQRDKLVDIHHEIARRDETITLMGRALDEQDRRLADLSSQIETARRTIIGVVASQRPKTPVEPPRQSELALTLPVVETAPEPQPSPIERVTIQQVYDLIGIDRRKVKIDKSFAGLVRMGLEHYHEKKGAKIEKTVIARHLGKPLHANLFVKDLVMPWYEERGRENLRKHLRKQFRSRTLAGLA